MEQRPDFQDLMASVGFLLLQWGELEDVVARAIVRLSGGDGGPATANFKRWADLQIEAHPDTINDVNEIGAVLDPVRQLRNLVAHGIIGASADYDRYSEPTLRCVDFDGRQQDLGLSKIQHAIREIERQKPRIDRFAPSAHP